MKPFRLLFALTLSCIVFSAAAQTKMIAHKSHSGTTQTFTASGRDDFGDPGPMRSLDSVICMNDSTVIEIYHGWPVPRDVDTVVHHPFFNDPKVSADSLRKIYPRVTFVGFDKKIKPGKKKTEVKRNGVFPAAAPGGQNGGLLLLIGITGVFLLLLTAVLWKAQLNKLKPVRRR